MNTTISWGIIGCGDVTEVKSGPAFNKVPDSRLWAVMRRQADKARDYAFRHKVPVWYSDAQLLIDDPDVNAIYIATPPLHHEEYTLKAIQTGKPVYLEKPMTLNAAGAKRIARAVQQSGIKLSVAHYRRQQPLFLKIKSLLEEGAIGDVHLVRLQCFQPPQSKLIAATEEAWRLNPSISGGGLFHDLAPHQLDLMIYFFGKPVKATGIATNTGGLYEADDTVSGQILFENGVLFEGTWCFVLPEEQQSDYCEIIGSKGRISFAIFAHQSLTIEVNGNKTQINFNKLEHVQQPMIAKVVAYFLDKAPNPCSVEEGVQVMQLIDTLVGKDHQ
jgi:predicted dehydrogenase